MRIDEILTEQQLTELDWRKGLATAAMAAGALGAMGSAHGRVVPGQEQDPGINRLTGKPIATQASPAQEPSASMPNQNLETAEKVERTANGITITHDGQTYEAAIVPKGSPVPRGAKAIKVQQGQLGIRGIGNYTTYLLPNGKAYIYQ